MEIQNLPKNTNPLQEHELKIFENLYSKEFFEEKKVESEQESKTCDNKKYEIIWKSILIIIIELSFQYSNMIKKYIKKDMYRTGFKILLLIALIPCDYNKCNDFFQNTYSSLKKNDDT